MRRRPRIRQKALVVDDTTTLDMSTVTPHLSLDAEGQALWDYYAAEPPFWWTHVDIPSLVNLCVMTDQLARARHDGASEAGMAAISKEVRQWAGELGLTPTSRGRLKLTEAQGVAAAKKIEQMEADYKRKTTAALDIDELMAE